MNSKNAPALSHQQLTNTYMYTHPHTYTQGDYVHHITSSLPYNMKLSGLLPMVGLTVGAAVTTSTPHVWSTPQGGNYQGVLSAHTGMCVHVYVCIWVGGNVCVSFGGEGSACVCGRFYFFLLICVYACT